MLALTDQATDVIEEILAAPGMPESAGVRIAAAIAATDGSHAAGLELMVAAGPDEGDEVIEERGARVFVEDTVAAVLDDKLLDAAVMGEEVRFSIATAP